MRLFLLSVFLFFCSVCGAQSAHLNTNFGTGGYTTLDFFPGSFASETNQQVLYQPDGGLLVIIQSESEARIARYKGNGMLDSDFGNNGYTVGVRTLSAAKAALQKSEDVVLVGNVYNGKHIAPVLYRFKKNGQLDAHFTKQNEDSADFGLDVSPTSIAVQTDGKIVVSLMANNIGPFDFMVARYNEDGLPDSSFSTDGKQISDFGSDETANALAIQADGKIVVAGSRYNGNNNDFTLARYNTNGTLDSSFSSDGKQIMDVGFYDNIRSIAIQEDGKIVVGGYAQNTSTYTYGFALARYNENGELDASFSEDGKIILELSEGSEIYSIALQDDGKIVAAGTLSAIKGGDIGVVRLNSNGTLDSSFSDDGIQTTDFGGDEYAYAIVVQKDNKVVVTGTFYENRSGVIVARYNSKGTLDDSFLANGKQVNRSGLGISHVTATAIQQDGKIIVAGVAFNGKDDDIAVARYHASGLLDTSFSNDGIQITDLASYESSNAVAIQKDGKIVVVGRTQNGYFTNVVVVRYNPDGRLDSSFSNNGKAVIDFYGDDFPFAVAIQKDSKIVIAGYSYDNISNNGADFLLMRLNKEGSLDRDFADNGRKQIDLGNYEYGTTVVINSSEKIIVGGYRYNGSNNDFALAQVDKNGRLDKSFSKDGKQITGFGKETGISSIAVQEDDKIIVAGFAASNTNYTFDFTLARYNSNGELDSTFAGNGIQIGNSGLSATPTSMLIQNDGKYVVTGSGKKVVGNSDFIVERYNLEGARDSSFGTNGVYIKDFEYNEQAYAAAYKDDTLYVVGATNQFGGLKGIIASYIFKTAATTLWYQDVDGDGYGNASVFVSATSKPSGYVEKPGDCNDDDNMIHPHGPSICDGKDNDCDGFTDEKCAGATLWYKDADGDGYGDPSSFARSTVKPLGYVSDHSDCNDEDKDIHPHGPSLCDGKDNDCDGLIDEKCGMQAITADNTLNLFALPNPSTTQFTVRLQSSSNTPVQVRIISEVGKVVEVRKGVGANSTFTFGQNYRTGIYYVEVTQAGNKTTLKLLKTNR